MKFITGNNGKFEEMKLYIPTIEQYEIDLSEIQDINPKKVIEAKLYEAQKHIKPGEEIIIEDTSLIFHEMNNLPGPFIKWFLDDLGIDGLWKLAQGFVSKKATETTIIGYLDRNSNMYYFTGSVDGNIVQPRGIGFGWNPLFQAEGIDKSFIEMNTTEKKEFSMRWRAASKLTEFLNHNKIYHSDS